MSWISVKDRLPKKEGDYLVYALLGMEDSGITIKYFYDSKRWEGYGGEWITHWRRLPKPPKEKEGASLP